MITISHKIELVPNNKQKSYFRKAFGCARLAYNWGIAEWQRRYKEGDKVDAYGLKKAFNAIKKEEFPFVVEVTKYATQQPFINLGRAFKKFFEDLKKGIVSYPQFKRKKDNEGSFYIGGDQVSLSDTNRNSKAFRRYHTTENRSISILSPQSCWVKILNGAVYREDKRSGNITAGNKYFALSVFKRRRRIQAYPSERYTDKGVRMAD